MSVFYFNSIIIVYENDSERRRAVSLYNITKYIP